MDHTSQAPRTLPFRYYYKWYAYFCAFAWLACIATLSWMLFSNDWRVHGEIQQQMLSCGAMLFFIPALYLWWIHPKITQTVQVHSDHIRVSNKKFSWEIAYNDIMKIERSFGSFIRLRMNDGHSWWFSSSLERTDYLWEGLKKARPELMGSAEEYEEFRLLLVQCDHHEKRKEWFFRHRLLDVVNWIALPAIVLGLGYQIQSQDIVINSPGLYFFRLGMYTLMIALISTFAWSLILKKFVFDRNVAKRMEEGSKLRDVAYEDKIIQRSKWFQVATCALLLAFVVKNDLNLFSITKLRQEAKVFQLTPGKTVVIDNRFNCVECKHSLQDGDVVLFGKGTIGQILARPGEVIAQTKETSLGRSIASETVTEVPQGQIALKTGEDGKQVILVPIGDLVGKLKTP